MDITTIKYPSHNELVQWYYQLAQKLADAAGVTPEQVNVLIAAYIDEHPYPVVPADIITVSNAAANVVTSVNGEKGDVTVTGGGDVPDNVITTDNIGENAVTSFNGAKGVVNYTAPVTSVNGMTGDVYTPVIRTSSSGPWAIGIRVDNTRALIFIRLEFKFEGIDISYNTTIPADLEIKPITLYSWMPAGFTNSAVTGATLNTDNRTIKIKIYDVNTEAGPPPPTSVWADCILYGYF